mgnify:CR=1 FL=1
MLELLRRGSVLVVELVSALLVSSEEVSEEAKTEGSKQEEVFEEEPEFLQFSKDHTLHPYRTEWRIYFEEYGVAGTLDFLEYQNGVFTIYDWKRSEKLVQNGTIERESRWGNKALAPVSHLSDTTYYHYALQVSMYRYILEQKYDIHVYNPQPTSEEQLQDYQSQPDISKQFSHVPHSIYPDV